MKPEGRAGLRVRSAVQQITSSGRFKKAARASQILRYVVEKTLAGEQDLIKEYTIAAEVFGREEYDPKVDAVVRVEAARLRKLLDEYYENEGSGERIPIRIERGGSVPRISEYPWVGRITRWAAVAALALIGWGAWHWTG